jgi:hypothetical protein
VLLKGQGLTIERPPRTLGTAIGAAISAFAIVLAVVLVVRAAGWPISFPQFLAYTGAGLLVLLAAVFAFWAYACFTMRYVLDRTGITISWGPVRCYVPINRIEALVHGRGEHRPQVMGMGWTGYHIGRGYVEPFGNVLFFSTHRSPEDLIYVQTSGATYALSPANPIRFISEAQRFQQAAKPEPRAAVERDVIAAHPIWADRVAQGLALVAITLNVALWGYVFAVYPGLAGQITIEFPPVGEITNLAERIEILKVPATAVAILAVNLIGALAFQWKERAAAYLLLSGGIFFQVLFWVAAAVAVINA